MTNSDEEDGSLDAVILQIFEEHADKFTFPLTTQKQTRDFVRLLNRKGFDYEMLADEVDEKLTYFQSWRLGSDKGSIGAHVMKRINRPLQDAMLSDDDDKVVDKVKKLLFYGMSVDVDEAAGALDIIDEKRRKKVIDRSANNTTGKQKNEEQGANLTESCVESGKGSDIQNHDATGKKFVKSDMREKDLKITKNEKDSDQESSTAKSSSEQQPIDKVQRHVEPKKICDLSKLETSQNVKSEEHLKELKPDKPSETSMKNLSCSGSEQGAATTGSKKVAPEDLDKTKSIKSDELNMKLPIKAINENPVKSSETVDTNTKVDKKDILVLIDSKKSENQEKHVQPNSKSSDLPVVPTSHVSKSLLTDPLPSTTTFQALSTTQAMSASSIPTQQPIAPVSSQAGCSEDIGVQQLKVSFGAKTHPASSPLSSGFASEKAMDTTPSIEATETSSKNISAAALPSKKVETVNDKFSSKPEVVSIPKNDQSITPELTKILPTSPLPAVASVTKEPCKIQDTVSNNSDKIKPTICWTDSVDSSTASESESSSSSSGTSSTKLTKTTAISSKSDPKCTARILPALPKHSATERANSPNAWISNENYDSDLDWDEMNKLSSPTPQVKLVDSIRLFKKSVSEIDGPGFIYVMSDTSGSKPVAALDGMHRLKIGISRFPLKRFEQAKTFNPDIKLLCSVPVRNRRSAMCQLGEELFPFTYREIRGWYRGPIVKILQSLEEFEKS